MSLLTGLRARSRFAFVLPIAATLLGAAPPAQSVGDPAAAQRIRADVEFLASDLLEGRDTGSRGYDIAAAYVATQFRAVGLKPAGENGSWLQQVPFRRSTHVGIPQASVTLGGKAVALRHGPDFAARPSLAQQQRAIDAPLVFAGHGISDRALGIDDYAGLDARGKIVVVLEGTPKGLDSEVASHVESSKERTAASKGAIGLVTIANSSAAPAYDILKYKGRPVVDWVDPAGKTVSDSNVLSLSAAISQNLAKRIFAAARQDYAKVRASGFRAGAMRGFDLGARLSLRDQASWQNFTSPEVVGLLPGSDPRLRDEYVVLMGHLDHLGINPDAKPGEDAIYNGALDNAAGVATMLEAARSFATSGKPPRRSVLFIANTGEEKGLRGADYFAANPTVPRSKIVGVVDLDMPVLLYDFTDVTAFGADHSTVAVAVRDAARSIGVKVAPDPMPEEAIFTRSDHYRFVTRGIPAILLMTGYGNGGERKWKDFFAKAYHKVTDDMTQPIRWDQGARYADLNYRIARSLADADTRPLWYESDYFGDMFAPGQPKAKRARP